MSAPAPCALLFEAREQRLAALDALARNLWLGGMTNAQGTLEARLSGLSLLVDSLLAGSLPPPAAWPWPPPPLAAALSATMAQLGLPGYCRGQRDLSDTVVMSILFHLDLIVDYRDRGADEDTATAMALDAFAADWKERCGQIDELVDVFGMLPEGDQSLRWDMICGQLRSEGWQEVLRIRRLLERLPELGRLIRQLGRSRQTDEPERRSQRTVPVMERALAQHPQPHAVHVPDLPGETRGIKRSDRIARMLPAEAMLLGHPRLRLVWHARRAERTLLAYEDDDRMAEVRQHRSPVLRPQPQPAPDRRMEMGPMLICVDTSGSMQGGAEAVAKATVLEAVRSAHAQHRACHVFAFGGPDELVEMELGVDAGGIERLIRFLGQTFRGGTDICGPLERAIEKLDAAQWRQADLLLASDGAFGATADVVSRLDQAKTTLGLRVQAILIGDRETIGLLELADDVLWVRDWRRFGASDADSPVHSKSLTAMYFPGALRSPENRRSTVAGDTASAAVRAGLHRGEHLPDQDQT